MNSIIHAIYYHRYRPKTMGPAIASECAEMFDVGFCMGARIMLEVLDRKSTRLNSSHS